MQVGPQERRPDTDQQHPPPLAFRTGGTLNLSERKNGRQRLKFRHDASLEHDVDEYALSAHWFAVQYCSVLKKPPVISDQRCFAVTRHFNPATHAQKKDRAVFADGPSQGGNAREGQRQRAIADVHFANQSATRIDGAQFLHAFSDFAWLARRPLLLPDDVSGGLPEYARTRNNDGRQGVDDPLDVASGKKPGRCSRIRSRISFRSIQLSPIFHEI